MKFLFLIAMLFLTDSFGHAYVEIEHYICPHGHLCHDPFRPTDRLILMPERKLIRMEREGDFRIYVENAFSSVLRDLRLIITNPAFEIETVPESIAQLIPGEKTFYLVRLRLREGFEPGDYPLRISVTAKSAELIPSIEVVEVVAEEIIIPKPEPEVKPPEPVVPPKEKVIEPEEITIEPPVQPVPEVIIPEPEPQEPVAPVEEKVLITEDEEVIEPQEKEVGEIVVRVEEFVLARRWYLYLIPILLLIGLLVWRRLRLRQK